MKATVTCQSPLIVYDPANRELVHLPPTVTWDVQQCSEGDLLDLQRVVKSGQDQVQVRNWLKKVRQADEPKAQAPLEIKIVNASEIGKVDRVLTIKRNESGQMTGATAVAVGSGTV